MNTSVESLTHKMQRAAVLVKWWTWCFLMPIKTVRKPWDSWWMSQSSSMAVRSAMKPTNTPDRPLTDPDSKWSKLINCVLDQTAPQRGPHHGPEPRL